MAASVGVFFSFLFKCVRPDVRPSLYKIDLVKWYENSAGHAYMYNQDIANPLCSER
jgi:hypothetical protein